MTIRKKDGEIVCECDECGEEDFGGTEDDGWKIRKDGEVWEHICPGCQEG